MKIGILTLPLHNNYGGNLQAYALMKVLKDAGHNPYLIAIAQADYPVVVKSKQVVKQIVKFAMGKFKGNPFRFFESSKINNRVGEFSEQFINKYITPQASIEIQNNHDFKALLKMDFDAFVVGSDQVWRKNYIRNYLFNYFFDFAKELSVKKLAYAASFGVDHWQFNEQETARIKALATLFDGIGVREDSAIPLCKDYMGVDVQLVLDPTLLLAKEDYDWLIEQENAPKPEGTMMTYVLDISEEKQQLIKQIEKDTGLSAYTVNPKSKQKDAPIEDRVYPPVTNWLRGFRDAKFVVTDSFHGTAFSILMNKPFIVIANKGRGIARFQSILKLFGLENRLLLHVENYNKDLIMDEIDWGKINRIREQLCQISKEFLIKSLRLK